MAHVCEVLPVSFLGSFHPRCEQSSIGDVDIDFCKSCSWTPATEHHYRPPRKTTEPQFTDLGAVVILQQFTSQ